MAFSQAGQRPVDPILARSLAEGTRTPYLVDQAVLPLIDVKENISGTYMVDSARQYNTLEGIELARSRGADRATLALQNPNSGTFDCEIFADKVSIDLQRDPMTDQMGMLETRRGIQAARAVKLGAEIRLNTTLFTTGNWTGSAAITDASFIAAGATGTQWNQIGATPMADLNAIANNIFHSQSYGEAPNTMVLSHDVAVTLNNDSEVRGYLNGAGTQVGVGTRNLGAADNFAQLRGILGANLGIDPERIFIGSIVQDTANVNQAEVRSLLWSDGLWMGFVSLEKAMVDATGSKVSTGPSAGFDFSAFGFRAGAYNETNGILRWVYAEQANDYVATNADLGLFVSDVLV